MLDSPGLLVCQETLGPIVAKPEGLYSPAVDRLYPIQCGLTYFGYPARDAAMIQETMAEEYAWQGRIDTLKRDRGYLSASAPNAVRLINTLTNATAGNRVLEIGSGSGWVSWLLREAGYDVWLCDFEANSLALGGMFQFPVGRRIVCDGRYVPFAADSFDAVICNEFVHHVADCSLFFAEVSRVLKRGGLFALLEPTMSAWKWMWELKHPDPDEGHHLHWPISYVRALNRIGFDPVIETALHDKRMPRNPVRRVAKQKAAQRVGGERLDTLDRLHLHVFGAAHFLMLSRKRVSNAPLRRPEMVLIDPSHMTTTQDDVGRYHAALEGILAENARKLVPR
jgi:SAM-dependent methyltransferase